MRNLQAPFTDTEFRPVDFEPLAAALVTIGHPRRLQIIGILYRHVEICVSDIVDQMGGLSQPTVSHHLRKLEAAGLVARRKQGPLVLYWLQRRTFAAVAAAIGPKP